MKVTILRSTLADGGKDFQAGDTPEIPDSEAIILFSVGAAKRFEESAETPEKQPRETAEAKPQGKEKASR